MRSKRMQPVAQHAEQIEQEAVQRFVQAQNDLEAARQQLQQLMDYREEYAQKLSSGSSMGMTIQRMRDYQVFIEKLGRAIDQAHRDIASKQNVCEQKKLDWLKCRSRSQALEMVVEKYRLEEVKAQEKIEQKEQDEHGARLSRKNRS